MQITHLLFLINLWFIFCEIVSDTSELNLKINLLFAYKMPINHEDILYVIQQIYEHKQLKVTLIESAKGAGIVAVSALTGGLLGGPRGSAIGN